LESKQSRRKESAKVLVCAVATPSGASRISEFTSPAHSFFVRGYNLQQPAEIRVCAGGKLKSVGPPLVRWKASSTLQHFCINW